jgi:lipoprotein-releasing system ATP-binding protein
MKAIEATGIEKNYGNLQVLKGVNLVVEEGEVVSIIGASGAGKSTLLHILGTLDHPDEGKVLIHGENIRTMTPQKISDFRNQQIGFVFQFHNLLPELSCIENICLPGLIRGDQMKKVKERASSIVEILGLNDRLDHKPSELSGGEQQRTAVARALVNSPSIVFADEPSGNLDSKNANELHDLFFRLRETLNQTFVIVTHNMALAQKADRQLTIIDGRLSS